VDFEQARAFMVDRQLMARGIRSSGVLDAMRTIPRHCFVEKALQAEAYDDCPLPIGGGQTISQPYMVALMTELLDVHAWHAILEIGTGSGYQTALLSTLAQRVYTVERLETLSQQASSVLQQLGCHNVVYRVGDGTVGWLEHAPYDRIIVTAGAPATPAALLEQLNEDGKLVIPVGDRFSQVLQVLHKQQNRLETTTSCRCVFVKLIGKDGWPG
jgi:protein-L-isoaspartate(D-aspartate) O-methyltransferase